jgi:hypothetical protein
MDLVLQMNIDAHLVMKGCVYNAVVRKIMTDGRKVKNYSFKNNRIMEIDTF